MINRNKQMLKGGISKTDFILFVGSCSSACSVCSELRTHTVFFPFNNSLHKLQAGLNRIEIVLTWNMTASVICLHFSDKRPFAVMPIIISEAKAECCYSAANCLREEVGLHDVTLASETACILTHVGISFLSLSSNSSSFNSIKVP